MYNIISCKEISNSRKRYIESVGLNLDDYASWARKYNSLNRGPNKLVKLTFEDYITLALEAGITMPSQIGRNIDKYQMGRIGDIGNYEIGNCRFITMRQNKAEWIINGGFAASVDKKSGRSSTTHKGIATQAEKISKYYRVVSPSGDIYEGKNLNAFCKERNLMQCCMSEVCLGRSKHHKGWTGSYITKTDKLDIKMISEQKF